MDRCLPSCRTEPEVPFLHPKCPTSAGPAPPAHPNPLTCMKPRNWVCSKLLVSALLSLPSGSAELLYTKAAVAKVFSRSEPFPRASKGGKSYQSIRKSGIWDIIERNLSEPSWVGGNLCSFIKVNETETVYTHRGPGPDFIWSGPATCLTSHGNTPQKEAFDRSWGSSAGWHVRPIWSTPTLGIQQGPAMPWGQAVLAISWVHLDSQEPASGKTWPIWETWLNRNARVWASASHFSLTVYLEFWLDTFPPLLSCILKTAHSQPSVSIRYHRWSGLWFLTERQAEEEMQINTGAHCTGTHKTLSSCTSRGCSSAISPGFIALGLWKTWTPKGQRMGPFTFYWCQLLGYRYAGREREERHSYHLVNCVCIYIVSLWASLLISVSFNPPGTQGFPRETGFPSQ